MTQYFQNYFYFYHLKDLYVISSKDITDIKVLYCHLNWNGEHGYGEDDCRCLGLSFSNKRVKKLVLSFCTWSKYGDLLTTMLPSLILLPFNIIHISSILLSMEFDYLSLIEITR